MESSGGLRAGREEKLKANRIGNSASSGTRPDKAAMRDSISQTIHLLVVDGEEESWLSR
jgi:hypothetical protein